MYNMYDKSHMLHLLFNLDVRCYEEVILNWKQVTLWFDQDVNLQVSESIRQYCGGMIYSFPITWKTVEETSDLPVIWEFHRKKLNQYAYTNLQCGF